MQGRCCGWSLARLCVLAAAPPSSVGAVGEVAAPTIDDARRAGRALTDAGAREVMVFGSVAKGEARPYSDIDLVVVLDNLDYRSRRDTTYALGGWCQIGVRWAGAGWRRWWCGAWAGGVVWRGLSGAQPRAGVGQSGARRAGVGQSGARRAGVGQSGAQPRAHRSGVECSPSTPRRAMLAAAARRLKSASTLARPRTRAWRPPCFRRTRCASLRSTLGRTAR